VRQKRIFAKKRIAKQENFRTEIEKIVFFFLKDIDAVQMGRNFIDTFPVDYFTDIGFISRLDNLIMTNYSQIGELLLQSNLLKERKSKQRTIFFFFNVDEPDEYLEELVMFSKVLNEQSPNIYVAYDFIRNVAIEHFAQKWEQNYKQHFNDINDLSLKTAIERYCAIETINYQDPILAGIFAYYLIKHEKFGKGQSNYVNCVVGIFADTLNEILSRKKHNNFVNKLKTPISKKKYTLQDVDSMDGQEFEKFLAEMFSKKGFETEITKATGDQGIDVIISKNGSRIGIQAKCYSGTVGNSAIQEVFAGKSYYRLDKVMVVTNRLFTDSAQQLARVNSVILWDRNILKEKIDEIFNSSPE